MTSFSLVPSLQPDLRGDKLRDSKPEKNAIPCDGIQYRLLDQLSVPTEMDEFEKFCAKLASDMCVRISILPSRNFEGYCAQEYHFRIAESQFLRMSPKKSSQVIRVDYIYNAILRERFYEKKEEFKKLKTPDEESMVLVFEAMTQEIDKIVYKGFQPGSWVYTEINPDDVHGGLAGSKTVLLCHALLGTSRTDHKTGYGGLTVKSGNQLLPKYLVHFR